MIALTNLAVSQLISLAILVPVTCYLDLSDTKSLSHPSPFKIILPEYLAHLEYVHSIWINGASSRPFYSVSCLGVLPSMQGIRNFIPSKVVTGHVQRGRHGKSLSVGQEVQGTMQQCSYHVG